MNHREEAKEVFVHYFKLALTRAGVNWHSDCQAEIEAAIDMIITAAIAGARAEKEGAR
jgi:hypothetical protein